MKPNIYGIIGIAIGLLAVLTGIANASGGRSDAAIIGLFGGIFLFGCGLIAAAVGAKNS